MRTIKSDDREERITQCVSLIAHIRRARGRVDFQRLSDAELITSMADRLAQSPDQHRLIACAFALRRFDVGRAIEPLCELLRDLGIHDVDPQSLIAMRRCALLDDFSRALRELNPDGELSQMDRLRELAIRVGRTALGGNGKDVFGSGLAAPFHSQTIGKRRYRRGNSKE